MELHRYVGKDGTDPFLLQVWAHMIAGNDLVKLFGPRELRLEDFCRTFRPPTEVYACSDAVGIWLLIWFAPTWLGWMFSGWIRPDWRHQAASKAMGRAALLDAVERHGAVVGLTRQPMVARYVTGLGMVPGPAVEAPWICLTATPATVRASLLLEDELEVATDWA